MGQRTKNRILEHSPPGHRLTRSNKVDGANVVAKDENADSQFWVCTCGWGGWLTKDLDAQEKG